MMGLLVALMTFRNYTSRGTLGFDPDTQSVTVLGQSILFGV
jgi:hypothetical protein